MSGSLIYGMAWSVRPPRCLPVLLWKRVLTVGFFAGTIEWERG